MKDKTIDTKKHINNFFIIFLFLSLKYYLFTDFFSAEIPWFGLNEIFSSTYTALTFLLSILHLILCSAALMKIQAFFYDKKLLLIILVTDPFYLTCFFSMKRLLLAVLFEILIVAFSTKKPIINSIFLSIFCLIAPSLMYNQSFGILFFSILIVYFLTKEMVSKQKAFSVLLTGIIFALSGYGSSFLIRNDLSSFSMWFIETSISTSSESELYKTIFGIILCVFEVVFWISQTIDYIKSNKSNKQLKKNVKSYHIKGKQKKKSAKPNYTIAYCFFLGLPACIIPLIGLMCGGVYDAPTVTLSFVACILAFNTDAPNKINNLIKSDSLVLAMVIIIIYSLITKELFHTSNIMKIINDFAPM